MNRPVLIFSGHSKYCELLLPDVNRCEVDFQQLCIDSAIIRKKCSAWGVRYVPSILELTSKGVIVHEGYDQCYAYMQAYMPEPEPEPLPKRNPHRYEMAVPKVKHVDRERSSRGEPRPVDVPMDPDQELLDLTASSAVSSLSDLLLNLEKDEENDEEKIKSLSLKKETISRQLQRQSSIKDKEINPHTIQEKKIQTFNEDKQRRAEKLEKKARLIAKKNEEEDLVSLAKRMQKARDTMDTKSRQIGEIPEGKIGRSHSLPTMKRKTTR